MKKERDFWSGIFPLDHAVLLVSLPLKELVVWLKQFERKPLRLVGPQWKFQLYYGVGVSWFPLNLNSEKQLYRRLCRQTCFCRYSLTQCMEMHKSSSGLAGDLLEWEGSLFGEGGLETGMALVNYKCNKVSKHYFSAVKGLSWFSSFLSALSSVDRATDF